MQDEFLGDYKILKQLGRGALGITYLASHRFMKKNFALKVLSQEWAQDQQFLVRFEKEMASLALLDHPNIVKVHNVSVAHGQYFLVTDCVCDEKKSHTNLAMVKESWTEDKIYTTLMQIAQALDFAHSKSIAHLDLKLNNILVGENGDVLISDFGLAKVVGSEKILASTQKAISEKLQNDSFHQTYAFLAPEQRRGEKVGCFSDVYAFGVLAHTLLTGAYPEGVIAIAQEKYDWNALMHSTLQSKPEKRATLLTPLLEEIVKHSKKIDLEQSIAKILPQPVEQKVFAGVGASSEKEPILTEYHPAKREAKNCEPLPSEMVSIQGGEFFRGSALGNRDETPRHKIALAPFAIDIHPVTNEQFVRFLEYIGAEKDQNHELIRLKDSRITRQGGRLSIETGYAKHPVVGVTWYGATEYSAWLGKRLPTEGEWEIACLGGGDGPYPTGESIEKNLANFFSADTTPVMSYAPNRFGLYDMAGNVYEWCQDWYGYNYYETSALEPSNPKGPPQGVYRVLRGGCWKSLKEDLRASHRHRNNPGSLNGTYGFRCAKDL